MAATAAGGDLSIGDIVMEALWAAGQEGIVSINDEEGPSDIQLVVEEASPFPILKTSATFEEVRHPFLLLATSSLGRTQFEDACEIALDEARPLICISSLTQSSAEFTKLQEHEVLTLDHLSDAADWIVDLSVMTGAKIVDSATHVTSDHLGRADLIKGRRHFCLVYGGEANQNHWGKRFSMLESLMEEGQEANLSDEILERYQQHLCALTSNHVEIVVSGTSSVDRDRGLFNASSGLHLARAAMEDGWVSGGGAALTHCASHLDQSDSAMKALANALQFPMRCLFDGDDEAFHPLLASIAGNGQLAFDPMDQSVVVAAEEGPLEALKVTILSLEFSVHAANGLLSRP